MTFQLGKIYQFQWFIFVLFVRSNSDYEDTSTYEPVETLEIWPSYQHPAHMMPSRINLNLEFKRLPGLVWLIISSPQQKVIVFGLGWMRRDKNILIMQHIISISSINFDNDEILR